MTRGGREELERVRPHRRRPAVRVPEPASLIDWGVFYEKAPIVKAALAADLIDRR
jgi:hypothetical protein